MNPGIEAHTLLPWAGTALGLVAYWGARRARRLVRLMADTPTSKALGVFIGQVELTGTAESERPHVAYLSGTRCVYHLWRIEERWSRTVQETYTDSHGKTQTRTRTESGWSTVAGAGRRTSFYLQDDSGAIRVVPKGARIEPVISFQRTCGRRDPIYYGKGPREAISNSDHVRRFHEESIPLRTRLYVFGTARQRQDVVAAEIAHDRESPLFLISTRDEQRIRSGKAALSWSLLILAAALAVGGWIAPEWIEHRRLDTQALMGSGAGFACVWFSGWLWTVYNSLTRLRQRTARAWSHIDVELNRRHDLIPQLLAVVAGLRDHERDVQTALAHLRSQAAASAPGEQGPDPESCGADIRLLREAYPELATHAAFTRLQREIAETEERIALARTYFNELATFYNTRLDSLPDLLVARPFHFLPRPLLHPGGFERPDVRIALAQ